MDGGCSPLIYSFSPLSISSARFTLSSSPTVILYAVAMSLKLSALNMFTSSSLSEALCIAAVAKASLRSLICLSIDFNLRSPLLRVTNVA